MKYIIRSGKVRGEGAYWCESHYDMPDYWSDHDSERRRFDTREEAEGAMAEALAAALPLHRLSDSVRIVRLLSHEEAKAKAVRLARVQEAVEDVVTDRVADAMLEFKMRRVLDSVGVPKAPPDERFPQLHRFLHLMADLDAQFRRVKPLQALIDLAKTAPNFATSRAVKGDMEYEINVKRADGRWPIEVIEELKAKGAAVAKLLEENGCDCACGCHPAEHDDCDRCLACRISEALA